MRAAEEVKDFTATVWEYYRQHARSDLPWRQPEADGTYDAYKILVSEIMLQQTQVSRVVGKYNQFLADFPNVIALADAEQANVIQVWSGLGYNRRARYLHQAAKQIVTNNHNTKPAKFPSEITDLVKLSGVGINTAAAVRVYAFDLPAIFVETNIRSVYIHHFFPKATKVTDAQLRELVEQSLPPGNYREWYWALMDYGSYLKATVGNDSKRSRQYLRQTPFAGSLRQIRGQVLRELTAGAKTYHELQVEISDGRLENVLTALVSEELIYSEHNKYRL